MLQDLQPVLVLASTLEAKKVARQLGCPAPLAAQQSLNSDERAFIGIHFFGRISFIEMTFQKTKVDYQILPFNIISALLAGLSETITVFIDSAIFSFRPAALSYSKT